MLLATEPGSGRVRLSPKPASQPLGTREPQSICVRPELRAERRAGASVGNRRPPHTYTVQLALPPQVVGVAELLEGVLEVDSYQGS